LVTPVEGGAATSSRIHDAALCLFAKQGYAATGIREVARDAGVTTAALYHHMGSKQDLLLNLMRAAMHEFVDNARAALKEASGPPEEIVALARSHVIYNGRNLLKSYVTDNEIRSLDAPNRARIVRIRDSYEDLWEDVLRRGVESGDFHITNQKVFRLAAIQMCNGVTYWYSPAGEMSLTAIADEIAGLCLAMAGHGSSESWRGRLPGVSQPQEATASE
jgi:TetR/AcrR family transcriptional regulator, cholesterol catabolism regulator